MPMPMPPGMITALTVYTGKQDWVVAINGVDATRVTEPTNGPLMVEHRDIGSPLGYPTSLWEIHAALQGIAPPWYSLTRYVPVDRDFGKVLHRSELLPTDAGKRFEWVTSHDLHEEASSQRWRGRPSSFMQYNVETLHRWRELVFTGDLTIRALATEADVSEPAAARFAHAEILWWI